MPKYRKKPVVIEALQFNKSVTPDTLRETFGCNPVTFEIPRFYIDTLEGRMEVSLGDWIIKGVNGEFYPCKSEIFEKTYEPVE